MKVLIVDETVAMQLQFWNPKTRHYEVDRTIPRGDSGRLTLEADDARLLACGRAWRICRADRPTKNPKVRAPVSNGYSRDKLTVVKEYLAWARAHSLTQITAFTGTSFVVADNGKRFTVYKDLSEGFTVRRVDPDAYFAVTEEREDDWLEVAA